MISDELYKQAQNQAFANGYKFADEYIVHVITESLRKTEAVSGSNSKDSTDLELAAKKKLADLAFDEMAKDRDERAKKTQKTEEIIEKLRRFGRRY